MNADLKTIGRSELRKDAWLKASGEAAYTADIFLHNTHFGALVRSPYHHAKVLSINASGALNLPGVLAVLTAQDVPENRVFGSLVKDQPVLAMNEVRHIGEPVAVVVAESMSIARKAVGCIQIIYEPLEAVLDPVAALLPESPLVHPEGNLLTQYNVFSGDVDLALSDADIVVEEDFSVQRISPAYMETENSLARWNPDGTLTVWVSSQQPFEDQKVIADVLGIIPDQVQVIGAVIGGAFGGKEDSSLAILAALAAWCTQGTVLIANNRHESFVAHPKRHPARLHLKLGAKRDGTLVGLKAIVHLDTGAYASLGPAVGGLLTEVLPGSYHIPNTHVITNVVYTHSPYSGAMRGFGSPQAHFAIESAMDMLSERLGIDPLELRRKNILRPGDTLFTHMVMDDSALSLSRCLDAAKQARERLRAIVTPLGKISGVGVALAMQSMGLGARVTDDSTQRLEWLPDGRILIYLGSPDLGQGLGTISEQMVAEALGIPYDWVITAPIDTSHTPDGGVTCASRMTYLVGNALLLAAEKIKVTLLEHAGKKLNISADKLVYNQGSIVLPDGHRFRASEFASRAADKGEPIEAVATASFPHPEHTPQHLPLGMPHVKYGFAAPVVRVEIDIELGTIEVKEMVAIHDVGKAINKAAVEGQIEGGVSMGIGYALYEDMALKPNQRWVDGFTEYLLPTVRDVPTHLEVQIIEDPDSSGPYGAKGVAEIALVPTAPAIANALFDALKIRVKDLPITPEKVMNLLLKKRDVN